MSKLFEGDSDSNDDIKTNNAYAKTYDTWRKKEELNKLKTKYGEDIDFDEESSSSSDDDEDGIELTEKVERDFFKTLACLKKKDPRIYDKSVKFFDDQNEVTVKKDRKKKDNPVYLKDYERNIILEKGGVLSDEEEDMDKRPRSPTYVEEQNTIKDNLKKALNSLDEEETDETWGGLFKERKKTKEEKEKEEEEYKKWLVGQTKEIEDKEIETELKPLKEYWNDPKLDEGEKFLKDYILNKRFLNKEDDDYIPTYDEIIHDSDGNLSNDEGTLEKQEEFEHKYNFRFEEPDQEFIKRYPRTMENSVRKTDDRRKIKRQETKERKKKEKEEKMKDLKKLQELKRKEIEEKLDKLREITGNNDIGFANEDVDGDFDPEAHDKRMQALFNDDFYEGPESDQKPEFPELDEELDIENWERYEGDNEDNPRNEPHCEDDNFNMDCDYDPQQTTQEELLESTRGRKKRKRKSKFAEAISKPKPKYDPDNKDYEQYFEEYYKLDCEDIIGDIPCRFKYRKVVPNDFGLSVEEILLAKERELNRWCSLKKAIQIRPDNVEKYEQIAYKKKSQNINLKKKILPSLFSDDKEDTDAKENDKQTSRAEKEISKDDAADKVSAEQNKDVLENNNVLDKAGKVETKKLEKKKNKNKTSLNDEVSDTIAAENTVTNTKIEKKSTNDGSKKSKKKKKNKVLTPPAEISNKKDSNILKKTKRKRSLKNEDVPKKKMKKENKLNGPKISDARLSAYGINPKKFKNKQKYGKK